MGNRGLWAWESKGEAVRLVNLESPELWKDEFPEDNDAESGTLAEKLKKHGYYYIYQKSTKNDIKIGFIKILTLFSC